MTKNVHLFWLLSLIALQQISSASAQPKTCDNSPDRMQILHDGKNIVKRTIQAAAGSENPNLLERSYYEYIPDKCANIASIPLIVEFHGKGDCADSPSTYTGFMQKAERDCAAMVWPIGHQWQENNFTANCFNVPGGATHEKYGKAPLATYRGPYSGPVWLYPHSNMTKVDTAPCCCEDVTYDNKPVNDHRLYQVPGTELDDTIFAKSVITDVVERYKNSASSIDERRIYLAGHSNGCHMAHAMAAKHSDVVAAIACHAGQPLTPFPMDYTPVPMWRAHGMTDKVVLYTGENYEYYCGYGFPCNDGGNPPQYYPLGNQYPLLANRGRWNVEVEVQYLGDLNGCDPETIVSDQLDENEFIVGKVVTRTNCNNNADVTLVALTDTGHNPYKFTQAQYLARTAEYFFRSTPTLDTSEEAWNFLKSKIKTTSTPAPIATPAPVSATTPAPIITTPSPTTKSSKKGKASKKNHF